MDKNLKTNDEKCSSLGWGLRALGVLGLGYLAYKKRDTLKDGLISVKDKTTDIVKPIHQGVKESTDKFQDFIENKSLDALSAVSSLTQQIEDKYNQLQGESKKSYLKALKGLHEKITYLENKVDK